MTLSWFQFRLRTLFAVVTVAAVACAWLGHEYHVVQERKTVREWIEKHGGVCSYFLDDQIGDQVIESESAVKEPSFLRRCLGDEKIGVVCLPATFELSDTDAERIRAIFPGAVITTLYRGKVESESAPAGKAPDTPIYRAPVL